MSIEEQKAVESTKPVTQHIASEFWKRGKKLVLLWQIGQTLFLAGAIIWGVGFVVESRIAEILKNPKRTTALEKQDSVKFQFVDSSLNRHDGLFTVIFSRIDTSARLSKRHIYYTGN